MGKAKFCGEELEAAIKRLPQGKPQMDAYWNAVRQADEAGDPYWRMMFRCRYCYEAVSYTHLDVYKRQTDEDEGRLLLL